MVVKNTLNTLELSNRAGGSRTRALAVVQAGNALLDGNSTGRSGTSAVVIGLTSAERICWGSYRLNAGVGNRVAVDSKSGFRSPVSERALRVSSALDTASSVKVAVRVTFIFTLAVGSTQVGTLMRNRITMDL